MHYQITAHRYRLRLIIIDVNNGSTFISIFKAFYIWWFAVT